MQIRASEVNRASGRSHTSSRLLSASFMRGSVLDSSRPHLLALTIT